MLEKVRKADLSEKEGTERVEKEAIRVY